MLFPYSIMIVWLSKRAISAPVHISAPAPDPFPLVEKSELSDVAHGIGTYLKRISRISPRFQDYGAYGGYGKYASYGSYLDLGSGEINNEASSDVDPGLSESTQTITTTMSTVITTVSLRAMTTPAPSPAPSITAVRLANRKMNTRT
jgi:hypothetical protein